MVFLEYEINKTALSNTIKFKNKRTYSYLGGVVIVNDMITLDMALKLPHEIVGHAKEYSEYNSLLSKNVCDNYDTKMLKSSINELFTKYKEILYLSKFSTSEINQKYELHENMHTRNFVDKVGNEVEKKIENQIWLTNFYNQFLNISSKLTKEEVYYLNETFFHNLSEETICEKMGICRNTLRRIKKSCLVKIWIEIQNII